MDNGTKGWQWPRAWVILSLGSLENGKDTFKVLDKQGAYSQSHYLVLFMCDTH